MFKMVVAATLAVLLPLFVIGRGKEDGTSY